MIRPLTLWLVIVAVGALTYLSRLSFIALFARWPMPPLIARALRFVPAAMLTAIVLPAVALRNGGFVPDQIAAALVAAAVAWRTRSVAATMVAGMIALWLLRWVLQLAA